MKYKDGSSIVMAIEFTGKNIKEIQEMICDFSLKSLSVTDINNDGVEFILCAYPYSEAMEEFPQVGDVYVVNTETQEIWLYTSSEFNARFKPTEA
jgi:hypothetical protein